MDSVVLVQMCSFSTSCLICHTIFPCVIMLHVSGVEFVSKNQMLVCAVDLTLPETHQEMR